MSPITHLLASWVVAAKTTTNPRDCRLVTLAGVLPDADGLGFFVDMVRNSIKNTDDFHLYQNFHHWYLHGIFGALVVSGILTAFGSQRWRVFLLCLLTFHLHLLCDLLGSRGPTPGDLWPIYYFGPLTQRWVIFWHHQWRLDGWQNMLITVVLVFWALWMASKRNDSVVGVFNRRADRAFLQQLKKWRAAVFREKSPPSPNGPPA